MRTLAYAVTLLASAVVVTPVAAQRAAMTRNARGEQRSTRSATGGQRPLGPGGFLRRSEPQPRSNAPRAAASGRSVRAPRAVSPAIIRAVEARLRPSTVRIQTPWAAHAGTTVAAGFVATHDGLIVTAAHVVAFNSPLDPVMVSIGDGPVIATRVVAYLPSHDIAVLRPAHPMGAPPLELGADDALDVGDEVLMYGHPTGLTESISSGMVNSHGRRTTQIGPGIEAGAADTHRIRGAIQIDAASEPGNSGGPVATSDGRVVGIVSAGPVSHTLVVPARQIRTALRMVALSPDRTHGPWPVASSRARFSAPTDTEGTYEMLPVHPDQASGVRVRSGSDRTHFDETRPDGRHSRSTLTWEQFGATHELPAPEDAPPN